MITVTNDSSTRVDVSINTWGSTGSTGNYKIQPTKQGTWSRDDRRGYLLVVAVNSKTSKYLVGSDTSVTIRGQEEAYVGGTKLKPLAVPQYA